MLPLRAPFNALLRVHTHEEPTVFQPELLIGFRREGEIRQTAAAAFFASMWFVTPMKIRSAINEIMPTPT